MTRAFVLSGGGNYGALQAGALEVLLRRGIVPDMLVGVSAGALNAAYIAAFPTPGRARMLCRVWRSVAPQYFQMPNRLGMLVRLAMRQDGLFSNQPLKDFILRYVSSNAKFGDFTQPRLYVGAARLSDASPRIFGDDPDERLLDGLMASAALPPLYPPWLVNGEAYVDGGAACDLPLRAACERGADEIFALWIVSPENAVIAESESPAVRPPGGERPAHGVMAIGGRVLSNMIDRITEYEIQSVSANRGVRLHLVRLWPDADPGLWDFNHAGELISAGMRQAASYIARMEASA